VQALSEAEKVPKTGLGLKRKRVRSELVPPTPAHRQMQVGTGEVLPLPPCQTAAFTKHRALAGLLCRVYSACRCRLARYTRSASTHTGRMRGYCAYGEDCDSVAHQGLMSQHACQRHRHQADPCAPATSAPALQNNRVHAPSKLLCKIEHVEHSVSRSTIGVCAKQ
jgi:hypothetical protein